jgi:CRISPR-associated endonuclease/helicase Cas3
MMDFTELFRTATGNPPFPYQTALAETPDLPDLLTVPTGCGKTAAVVLSWLWRRKRAPAAIRDATPRRLVYTLPVRTLVDQTERAARAWFDRLGLGDDVGLHVLMGGAVDQAWEGHPERDTLLIGTQDQLLSRALLRGYAMSRFRWPVHFGLLHNDAWWVFDETQLMGPALSTSAQLEGLRRSMGVGVACRSTWMSATNAPGRLSTVDLRPFPLREQGLTAADREHPVVDARLRAVKGLIVQPADVDPAAEALSRHLDGTRTLVVVNRVARAIEVFQAIEKRLKKEKRALPIRLVHSRYRPGDRGAQQEDALRPGFTGIVVATQAIEAGVDLSAATLITDLAPWSSLIQRFGRCNRYGELTAGEATAVVIDVLDKDASPYSPEVFADARRRLGGLTDVGPAALSALLQPDEGPAMPVIRRKDLLELFDTEPDLSGRHIDVARFLRDADDRDVQLAWRALGEDPPPSDSPALHRDELCRVGIGPARKLLKDAVAWRWDGHAGAWEKVPTAFGTLRIVPGDALLLDVSVGGYDPILGFTADRKHVPPPVVRHNPAPDDDDADPLTTRFGSFVTLTQHSEDVAEALGALLSGLPGDHPAETLRVAARWHDLGKAHPAFQAMLTAGLADDDPRRAEGPWAKSDGRRGPRAAPGTRRYLRHELASALVWLARGGDDLTAYLIAAHHGKVRVRLRSRPDERPPADRPDARPVLGVCTGDLVPEVDLGALRVPATEVSVELTTLGAEAGSWSDRMLRQLEAHGPFRLAWWETLVRVADWRGSALRNPSLGEAP